MPIGHVIVGGLGHLGLRVARELHARGVAAVAIEQTASASLARSLDDLNIPLIAGDLRDAAVLTAAGVADARAVLLLTGDDQTNLEAALAAREHHPDLRVIARIFDQTLATLVEREFGIQALSASFIAAPAFLTAATREAPLATFTIGGCPLHIARDADAGLRLTRGDTGWRYADAGAPANLSLTIGPPPHASPRHPRHPHIGLDLRQMLADARAAWQHSAPITRWLLAALLGIILLSVIIFSVFGGLTILDAFYFVIVTMSTVGYGDFSLLAAPPGLKLYGILLMLLGAMLLATLYAIIADLVLTARMEALLGRRPVTLSQHLVVVGLGKVGYAVASALTAMGLPVAAIEANDASENVAAARARFPVIIGDAARASVRRKAGLERAAVLLALTEHPMLNLSLALHARAANPAIVTIVRTYETSLAEKLRDCPLDAVISTSAIAAPVFVDAALHLGVEGAVTLVGRDALLVERIAPAAWAGLHARELAARGLAPVLLADAADAPYHLADADALLAAGQRIVLLLDRASLPAMSAAGITD